MAAIKLRIIVNELSNVLTQFDQIKVYRSTTGQSGPFSEISGPGTRVPLVSPTALYEYIDAAGDPVYWYRFSFYNSGTAAEGTASPPIQGEGSSGRYCTVQDIRDEGFTVAMYSDARVTAAIGRASKWIEHFTGRWFEPRNLDFTFDGSGRRSLYLEQPIIEITQVAVDDVDLDLAADVLVYNRHITAGLTDPDDRENPRLEMLEPLESVHLYALGLKVFPLGQQNIRIVGTFGYTDFDGTGSGMTPDLIRRACVLLTVRELPALASADRDDMRNRWRISELKTRDQTIKYGSTSRSDLGPAGVGIYTGDPEIDQILLRYRRPPKLRAV